ncbi:MAG: sugar ABC transporter permease [Lachnospiraceae bacterium]|nr:sugar ABC transporter permease [Lachnospiraceae bacterium]MCI9590655.1 sugar ABC transporter permease [Lachnospiraceae bacterium]
MEKRRKWTLLSLSIPAFLLIFIFMIVPLGNAVKVSFYKWNGYSQKMQWIGLKNYVSIFSDKVFLRSTMNTFIYGFGSTLIQNIAGLSAALLVNRQFRGRNFVRLILYMPIMISGVIMGAIQYYIFNYDNGVLNNLLNLIGIENIYWMQSGIGSVLIITLINSWQAMGFCMLIYLAGLQNIPKMYEEAALLDGTSRRQIFFKIDLPLLMPAITTAVITNLIGGFKLYDIIVTLTNGGPNRKSLSLSYYISLLYFNDEKAGYSAAVGIALFVIIFVVAVPINQYLRSREVEY